MSLKIICLEEHVGSAALAAVLKPAIAAGAPYQGDLGSEYQDDPRSAGDRPGLYAPQRANQLAAERVEDRLRAMDDAGIDMQILSYALPLHLAPSAADLVANANDHLAEMSRAHPDRFAGFAALPWQDTHAAVRELDRAIGDCGLRGVMLPGRPAGDSFLDDPRYSPILAHIAELRVPLYVHPGPPKPSVQQAYYDGFGKEVTARLSLFGWGWHSEAGLQVIRLILSGALDRFPQLTLISGHWGEMVPFFLQRLDDTMPPGVTGLSRTISETYRDQVYVTPGGMLHLPHFRFCREVLGPERILFSVDYPYLSMTGARTWLDKLPISDAERTAIAGRSAALLLRQGRRDE